ncbi:hypothetical protein ABIC78_004270 [Novosphingobium sp. 1529]|uniref:SIR2 family NAD-dependent protein deacylase n=1 Tax=Novosphingobium sp. 1529 TaxID=3156424 RepID=UPI00339AE830
MPASETPIVNPLAGCTDLPALEQLGRALWRSEGLRGAAVLVGAGLSREATLASADTPPPPLWFDLAQAMSAQLYPANPALAPWDPLRLAEEYRSYFGQSALDAFVRENVRDVAWQPGARHDALVALPWSDILTTNYDTLLERAARNSDRAYDPVRTEAEIAFSKAPRIVKLHGSVGATDHFVIAEEDYRTYPTRHAAFVNLARQCFVENELCLLGFSGDDPNFLAWAGWVRDHLGSAARRIFLAGALNLSPAKRKYLEARNIAPIDVFPLVKDLDASARHASANRLILEALNALRPIPSHEWVASSPDRLHDDRTADLTAKVNAFREMVKRWQGERASYPGWLICPNDRRAVLRIYTEAPNEVLLEALEPAEAANAVVEWCWRHQTALWPIHAGFIKVVRRFAEPTSSEMLSAADRLIVGSLLLEHARREGDAALFSEMARCLNAITVDGSDGRAELRYQEALKALHELDLARVEQIVPEISGPDPAWKLRRAGLLCTLGQLSAAEALISEALADMRDRERADRTSLWVRSRLAWALFFNYSHKRLSGGGGRWPERFRETLCDPWQEVERAVDAGFEERRKHQNKPDRAVPNFVPGSFRLPSRTIHFGDTRVEPSDNFALLFERGGVPARLEYMTMFVPERLDALELGYEPTLTWYLSLIGAGLNSDSPQIDRFFGRVNIARLDLEVVLNLVFHLKAGRDYWVGCLQDKHQDVRVFARDRLITLIELIGRLSVRLDDMQGIALHLETVQLSKLLGINLRFCKQVGNLLKNSFEAVSPAARAPMFFADLDLPLAAENEAPEPTNWIGLVPLHEPQQNQQLRPVVARYLDAAAMTGGQRSAAIRRLAQLHVLGALTPDEISRFDAAAWRQLDAGNPPLPTNTSIYEHFWATLVTQGRDAAALVQARLFSTQGSLDRDRFDSMIRAVRSGDIRPSADQARECFDVIVAMRFKEIDPNDPIASFTAGLQGYDRQLEANFAGAALTWALSSSLALNDLTPKRLSSLEFFQESAKTLASIGAMVPFVEQHVTARNALERLIRRGLTSQDSHQVAYAVDALRIWADVHAAGPHAPPSQLIDQIVSLVELRLSSGLPYLLGECERLSRSGGLSAEQFKRIQIALGDLLEETNYSVIDLQSERAGTVSLIRKNAARLALSLKDAGHASEETEAWLTAVRDDPLPEVRHALAATDA